MPEPHENLHAMVGQPGQYINSCRILVSDGGRFRVKVSSHEAGLWREATASSNVSE